jgi:hypothetical protein
VDGVDAERRPTPFGPGGTPRAGIRPWLALVGLIGFVVLIPLVFSDRIPGILDRASDNIENTFGDWYWHGIKQFFPRPDTAMHMMIFACAALVVGLLCWSWRTFAIGQIIVLLIGLVIEVLQPMFTNSRDFQDHDILGNLMGQTVGIVVALGCIYGWAAWERRRSAH